VLFRSFPSELTDYLLGEDRILSSPIILLINKPTSRLAFIFPGTRFPPKSFHSSGFRLLFRKGSFSSDSAAFASPQKTLNLFSPVTRKAPKRTHSLGAHSSFLPSRTLYGKYWVCGLRSIILTPLLDATLGVLIK